MFADLARALSGAGQQLPSILDALTTTLMASLCDRCSIDLIAGAALEPAPPQREVTPRQTIFPLAGRLVHGSVLVMRDDTSPSFQPHELADIETCIAYTTVAAELVIQLDAERAALRTEHERADQFHHTLLTVVGHDMRGPVAAILIGTEMLIATHRDDPSLGGVVSRIVTFANRMTAMVDQLLDLSWAQLVGGIPLARLEIRLAPLLQSVVEELAHRYPGNRFLLSGDAGARGAWDPDRLRQVTATLLTNAVRHGVEDGPIQIVMSQDDGRTSFSVHNEVCGAPIPPETLRTLFEPHRRGGEDESGSGVGLALYIVRKIVEAHGGRVAVDSIPTGTTFRVVLPNAQ